MKKIIIAVFALALFTSQSLKAQDIYIGAKASKLEIDYDSIEGVSYGEFLADDFTLMDYHLGYSFGSSYVELGYFKSDDKSKNIGSVTISGITFSASSKLDFDGFRLGYGYNYQVNDKLTITPSVNYYEVDVNGTVTATVASGSATLASAAEGFGGSDNMIDVGLTAKYKINEQATIGLGYLHTVDSIEDTDKITQLQLSASYKF
jgi:hypothetical protein